MVVFAFKLSIQQIEAGDQEFEAALVSRVKGGKTKFIQSLQFNFFLILTANQSVSKPWILQYTQKKSMMRKDILNLTFIFL